MRAQEIVVLSLGLLFGIAIGFRDVFAESGHITEIRGYVGEVRTLSGEVRDLEGFEVELEGLSTETGGDTRSLVTQVEDLEVAMADLEAKVEEKKILVELSSDVLFDFDKYNLKDEAQKELKKLLVIINQKRQGNVTILGYTDAKGSDEYNLRLSKQRAGSVEDWLVAQGVPAEVLVTKGMGESNPVAPNNHPDGSDNPEGRAKNRRVEAIIQTVK